MSTPRQIHMESTWILRQYVEDQISTSFHVISVNFFNLFLIFKKSASFSRTFFDITSLAEKSALFPRTCFDVISMVEKIYIVSTYFFQCNFDGRKMHVVSPYSFHCNFDGRKIHVVSTYFFRCNWSGRNIHVVFTYYFWRDLDAQKCCIVFGKLWSTENIREGFSCVCNFKQLTFARLFSLNFSSKSPSFIEIWVLQPSPLSKELSQVSFLGIYRTATLPNNFWVATLLWSYSCKKL